MKKKPTPVKGQKLYRFWQEIETATFIEESIVEGASIPTWLVRDDKDPHRRIRCSVGSWFLTEKEALQDGLTEFKESVKRHREVIVSAKQEIANHRAQIKQLQARLAEL